MAAEADSQPSGVANTSGITPDSLKATLIENIGAQYVQIDDISGMHVYPPTPFAQLLRST
jgi:stress-induced morphogen